MPSHPSAQPQLIHCSFHKCLTVFYGRIMASVFNRCLFWGRGYRHFNSHLADFYRNFARHRVASVNNRALDIECLGPVRISRFLRDPRDLIVSGYFYHRRGAEPWVTLPAPTAEDWYFANGQIPAALGSTGMSFAEYLQSVTEEEGLLAELEFRAPHLESMALWPEKHPHVRVFRYEDILGREAEALRDLFSFYEFSPLETWLGTFFTKRYSLKRRRVDPHVRNPASGQWRQHFTPRVKQVFDEQYGELVESLGYPAD